MQKVYAKSHAFPLNSGKILAGTALSTFIELPSTFLPSRDEKVQLIVHYSRNGLTPGLDPKTLVLDGLTITFLNKELKTET